jgi:hypothetical protein
MSEAVLTHHDDHHHGPASGITRWLFTTNHKDIGTLYLWFSFLMLLIGGAMALVIRTELFQPGLQFVEPAFFNQMTTNHGLIMVFGAIMPAFVGLANWLLPMMVGAPDMALPRMNNLSFWILPFAFGMLISTLFMEGGGPNFGWTFYAPLSTTYAPDTVTYFIFGVHLMGASSIMGSINIIATILNMRAPGMTLMKMPLFVWTWLITAYLLLAVMPVLAGAVTMMLFDIHFGTSFFNAAGGGDPVLFQHIFWFFGHPEVYIMILPAFGVVSQIIPTFARKPLFGYDSMVYATASIAFLSFIVWAHHMFTVGMPLAGQLFFMYATMLIAVPTGVKVFNWVSTMWRGGALPLRARSGRAVLHHRRRLLLAAQVVRPDVRRDPGQGALLAVVHRGQRDVLPSALLGPRRHAAANPRLRAAVCGLQHGLQRRGVHLRFLPAGLPLRGDQSHQERAAGHRPSLGGRPWARMDAALAGALPQLHDSAHRHRGRSPLLMGEGLIG